MKKYGRINMHNNLRRQNEMSIKKKRKTNRVIVPIVVIVIIAAVIIAAFLFLKGGEKEEENPRYIDPSASGSGAVTSEAETETETEEPEEDFAAYETDSTAGFPDSVVSTHGILIDVDDGTIVAGEGAHERVVPASMTKILTVLVAAENITEDQLDEVVTIGMDAANYSYANDCSIAGFEVDEQVPVRDLFYGTILPSGADAAYSLAVYVAGSHEAFVEKMNEKLEEMGLSETSHVTNCVGLYDEDHYTTPYDMALILKAASDNEFCREVLSTKRYTTSVTEQHDEGLPLSNLFLRRIEDKEIPGEVLCAKTGFVNQSGSCAASLAVSSSGKEYICVTTGSTSSWRCIYDHVDIYNAFIE
jgi:D-alanyl-D-alanine carboxypeptidase (penicillin-binding protein 5/6)